MSISNTLQNVRAFLTPRSSAVSVPQCGFRKAPKESQLFPRVNPAEDGEDCEHACATCEIRLPKGFKIDEDDKLYGHINGWATHMLVATGKTDWLRDVTDEKGSVMEAVGNCEVEPSNGKLMLSASNMPLPDTDGHKPVNERPTTVLLLPSFTFVDGVTPASVNDLVNHYISPSPTTTTPLRQLSVPQPQFTSVEKGTLEARQDSPPATPKDPERAPTLPVAPPHLFTTRPCPHKYLILMCSQRTRDARCGQSAPLLRRELERHLRPLGLYRELSDLRPGGVGIYFISHVGGHKYSANVMVYRRGEGDEASQCIWLARVRPEDCEGIVKFTVLQGKVVKPERQLRGGFNREKGLVSW